MRKNYKELTILNTFPNWGEQKERISSYFHNSGVIYGNSALLRVSLGIVLQKTHLIYSQGFSPIPLPVSASQKAGAQVHSGHLWNSLRIYPRPEQLDRDH